MVKSMQRIKPSMLGQITNLQVKPQSYQPDTTRTDKSVSSQESPGRHHPLLFVEISLHLKDEGASFHRVDQDVAALEQCVARPSTNKVNSASPCKVVILGINIYDGQSSCSRARWRQKLTEEADFFDTCTGRVLGDRSDIQDTEASAIVGLVCETVGNVLVMVDTLGSALVQSSLLWCTQRRNVPDVCDGVSRGARADLVVFIVLVVEQQILLVLGV
jgi:hypothetical protein